jgi:hypothetical protein
MNGLKQALSNLLSLIAPPPEGNEYYDWNDIIPAMSLLVIIIVLLSMAGMYG